MVTKFYNGFITMHFKACITLTFVFLGYLYIYEYTPLLTMRYRETFQSYKCDNRTAFHACTIQPNLSAFLNDAL